MSHRHDINKPVGQTVSVPIGTPKVSERRISDRRAKGVGTVRVGARCQVEWRSGGAGVGAKGPAGGPGPILSRTCHYIRARGMVGVTT